MSKFKQHDTTDCGPACLLYIFEHHRLHLSLSTIRQKAGTNQTGTTALGLVDTAREFGFEAKCVRATYEDLKSLPQPGIAHIVSGKGHEHYIVVCRTGRKSLKVMDPAVGRVERWSNDKFEAVWTQIYIALSPETDFRPNRHKESPWMRLLALLKPHTNVILQAFVGVIIGTLLSLSTAIFIQKIVDNVIVEGNQNLLRLLGFSMLVILALRILLEYFQSILILKCAQRIDAGLILGYYRHVIRLPQSFFDTMRVGEIISRMRDASALKDFLTGTVLNLIISPMILIFALSAMFFYSWKLALFSLALIPANILIYLTSDWLNRRYQREIMERSADFNSQVVHSLNSMSVVRSCGLENEMCFRSETRISKLLKRVWVASKAGLIIGSSGGLVTQAYTIGLLWIGANLVLGSQLTAGELMSCNALAGYITGPIVSILGMNASIRAATTATERLYEILDLECEKDEGNCDISVNESFSLSFENVSFCYPGRVSTLKNINFSCQSGTITALTGHSGGGKSTILGLIQRYYSPDQGDIILQNVNVAYLKLKSLRDCIAHVPQKIDLLEGTILENLAPGDERPDMPRILKLCEQVGILEFIESLPRGFKTYISENGNNLSGGQKQRIAIIRTLYSDTPIILLDEPSSALDPESEEMLVQTIQSMRRAGKLLILAIHNQRLIQLCDQIIELSEGEIKEISIINSSRTKVAEVTSDSKHLSEDCVTTDNKIWQYNSSKENVLDRLRSQSQSKEIYFGHDNANISGINERGEGWFLESGRCDFHDVTGNWPSVFGFEVHSIPDGWSSNYDFLVPKIIEAHRNAGIAMVSLYPDDFGSEKECPYVTSVSEVLPGGYLHGKLKDYFDLIATHLGNILNKNDEAIAIVLRLWPNQNGCHHWWGSSRCTVEEFKKLYRFSVHYLREFHKLSNFIFAYTAGDYSPKFDNLIERYPGDEWVDILGVESYNDESEESRRLTISLTREMIAFARKHGKIAAVTSFGFANEKGVGLDYCGSLEWIEFWTQKVPTDVPEIQNIAFLHFAKSWTQENGVKCYHFPYPSSDHAIGLMRQLNTKKNIHIKIPSKHNQ